MGLGPRRGRTGTAARTARESQVWDRKCWSAGRPASVPLGLLRSSCLADPFCWLLQASNTCARLRHAN